MPCYRAKLDHVGAAVSRPRVGASWTTFWAEVPCCSPSSSSSGTAGGTTSSSSGTAGGTTSSSSGTAGGTTSSSSGTAGGTTSSSSSSVSASSAPFGPTTLSLSSSSLAISSSSSLAISSSSSLALSPFVCAYCLCGSSAATRPVTLPTALLKGLPCASAVREYFRTSSLSGIDNLCWAGNVGVGALDGNPRLECYPKPSLSSNCDCDIRVGGASAASYGIGIMTITEGHDLCDDVMELGPPSILDIYVGKNPNNWSPKQMFYHGVDPKEVQAHCNWLGLYMWGYSMGTGEIPCCIGAGVWFLKSQILIDKRVAVGHNAMGCRAGMTKIWGGIWMGGKSSQSYGSAGSEALGKFTLAAYLKPVRRVPKPSLGYAPGAHPAFKYTYPYYVPARPVNDPLGYNEFGAWVDWEPALYYQACNPQLGGCDNDYAIGGPKHGVVLAFNTNRDRGLGACRECSCTTWVVPPPLYDQTCNAGCVKTSSVSPTVPSIWPAPPPTESSSSSARGTHLRVEDCSAPFSTYECADPTGIYFPASIGDTLRIEELTTGGLNLCATVIGYTNVPPTHQPRWKETGCAVCASSL